MQASTPKRYSKQLHQDGNQRPNLNLAAQDLGDPSKPKSILLATNQTPKKENLSVRFEDSFQRQVRKSPSHTSRATQHEWISSLMDNSRNINEEDPCESNFKDILEFRRVNREECECDIERMRELELGLSQSAHLLPQDDSLPKRKIHHYYVNDRLFLEPVYIDNEGYHETGTPSYLDNIRVTLRHSILEPQDKVKPHRRNSFDPRDSMSLSQHCLAGWKSSKLNITQSSSPMDLRSAANQPFIRTRMQPVQNEKASKVPSNSTKDLIDRMHAINYTMQLLEKEQQSLGDV
ncbi:uncharacterized protein TRIADDRAFT_57532 [Trichoplax adhaerens]|uniref:Uncharacterized protein n=1 Tax=Trichoplax adhaerens TaxID=10228 RepID=B3RZP9_TRIAD|nr:hypothetical protein TRIADDRAFT_57532 [Trichoplax adhaerens]EDV23879.1 hypothetical protein TRIADDRAFT_57532 [Trichoplax adhaerens]|eukprot:XP_002113405.1 hypothetical protein TRIADDRAFT_57532 [Trichoplax adhaerens]